MVHLRYILAHKGPAGTQQAQNCFIKFSMVTLSSFAASSKQTISNTLKPTTGTSSGLAATARLIFMKAWMSTKKLIIFPAALKSQEKINWPLTSEECNNDLASSILTSCQTPILFPTSLENLCIILTNLSKPRAKKTIGLWSQSIFHAAEASTS